MDIPKIAVVMPVWNGEAYLREAVESILAQSFKDFEFIILDDGSTDRTPGILAGYAAGDSRIKVIRLEHEGIVVALNRGVDEARAPWIARMDCDDVAHPERLNRQWNAVQANPEAVLCHTHVNIIGDPRYVTKAGRFVKTTALLKLRLCFQCLIIHPTVLFRKDAFVQCGGYIPEERHAEDFGLWGRLVAMGDVIGVPIPSLDFRVHGDSISKQKAEAQEKVSRPIALRHCSQFLQLDEVDSWKANSILRGEASRTPIKDWLWLIVHCLSRSKEQSLEMWAWIASQTARRAIFLLGMGTTQK